MFRFVQAEFPFGLGPPDGRYVLRGHAAEPEHVLVLQTAGAPQRRKLRGRRPKDAPPSPEPEPVQTTRVTLVGVEAVKDEREAAKWLDAADLDDEVDVFVDVLNRILQAQRIAAADAFAREVATDQALVVRVGYGDGDRVAEGLWIAAKELPREGASKKVARRDAALRPQERFASILGGRDVALACEELLLRARLDLDRGRDREGALQLRAAFDAALAELPAWTGRGDLDRRLEQLQELAGSVEDAAAEALRGGLSAETVEALDAACGRLEAALRARTAFGVQ